MLNRKFRDYYKNLLENLGVDEYLTGVDSLNLVGLIQSWSLYLPKCYEMYRLTKGRSQQNSREKYFHSFTGHSVASLAPVIGVYIGLVWLILVHFLTHLETDSWPEVWIVTVKAGIIASKIRSVGAIHIFPNTFWHGCGSSGKSKIKASNKKVNRLR